MINSLKTQAQKRFFTLILNVLSSSAAKILKDKKPKIVGVTGSVGKSSFIYLLDLIMKDEVATRTTFHGNSESGLPLEILGIRQYLQAYSLLNWLEILAITPLAYIWNKVNFKYQLVIAEMGIDSSQPPKNMSYLLKMVKPSIGVLLSVSPAHAQQFAEELGLDAKDEKAILQAIAQEKGKIVTQLAADKQAVINADSAYIMALKDAIKANITTFGASKSADYQLTEYTLLSDATVYRFKVKSQEYRLTIAGFVLSEEYGLIILSVMATAQLLGLEIPQSIQKLETRFSLPPGRMSLIETTEGAKIIDSSYNSSPSALSSMLRALKQYPAQGRKIVVLGDMRELGPLAQSAHQEIVKLVAEVADEVFLVGPLMKMYLLPELTKQGIVAQSFETSQGLGEKIKNSLTLTSKDVLLIKGSQNTIFLEEVVYDLMKHKAQASTLLCRQSHYWQKVRQNFFASQTVK